MRKNRNNSHPDENQGEIVKALRKVPGVSVEVGHDDIIVGYRGYTLWYEIKNPELLGKDGKIQPSKIKPSQKKLLAEYRGHYRIVWEKEQIVEDLNRIMDLPMWRR